MPRLWLVLVSAAALAAGVLVSIAHGQTGPAPPVTLPPAIDQWTTIVGVLLPLGIAALNRTAWGSIAKALMAFVACAGAALGDVYFKGQFSGAQWAQTTLYVFFLVVTTYHGFWKPTGIAEVVEKATG